MKSIENRALNGLLSFLGESHDKIEDLQLHIWSLTNLFYDEGFLKMLLGVDEIEFKRTKKLIQETIKDNKEKLKKMRKND